MKRVGQIFRETLVSHVKQGIDDNTCLFLLSYSELSGIVLSELRKNLKGSGAEVYVSKNSIAQIALKDLKHDNLAEKVTGQTAFVWSTSDSAAIAKSLINYSKEHENLKVQGGLLEGRILSVDDVKRLAELPSREILLSTLLATIQAPLTRFAGALNAKSRDLLSILKQLSEKKGGS